MKKRCICLGLILIFIIGVITGCAAKEKAKSEPTEPGNVDKIKIGVLMWERSDIFGSRCREMIDETAAALGAEVEYVDHHNNPILVKEGFKTLIADGCDGVIMCNASDREMSDIIDLADENGIYVAQFLRKINKGAYPETYDKAVESAYFIGSVHENEIEDGSMMAEMLLNAGNRNIGIIGWSPADNSWIWRREGIEREIDSWNTANPYDRAQVFEPVYSGITAEGGKSACDDLLSIHPDIDAIIVAGGGGEPLLGALSRIERGIADDEIKKVDVVSTDFLDDLGDRIDDGTMIGEAGGQIADPMFSFIMVYNTICRKPSYIGVSQYYKDVKLPYIYITSSDEYAEYVGYFVDDFPYTREEIREIADLEYAELIKKAAKHSLEDAVRRSAK